MSWAASLGASTLSLFVCLPALRPSGSASAAVPPLYFPTPLFTLTVDARSHTENGSAKNICSSTRSAVEGSPRSFCECFTLRYSLQLHRTSRRQMFFSAFLLVSVAILFLSSARFVLLYPFFDFIPSITTPSIFVLCFVPIGREGSPRQEV